MTALTHDTAVALCGLLGHTLTTYEQASHDPGAVICDTEGCVSQTLVGLHNARRHLHTALAALVVCGCGSPARCHCELEPVRNEVHRAEVEARATFLLLVVRCYPVGSLALVERIVGRAA